MEGNLIRKIQPIYPPLARSTGVQGSVLLQAIIGRDGKIVDQDAGLVSRKVIEESIKTALAQGSASAAVASTEVSQEKK